MKRAIWKSTFREIKSGFGRFMAIFAIIALGVGFFAGLKVTRQAMTATVEQDLSRHGFYDFRLISTLGFEQEDVDFFIQQGEEAEGTFSFDVIFGREEGSQSVAKVHGITEKLNTLELLAGRMPLESDECVADVNLFGESDIGSVIYLSEDNDEEDLGHFVHREYKVVGIVRSPLYLQYERGNTSLGTGRVAGFLCILPEGFDVDYYTEIYVKSDTGYGLYSEEYDAFVGEKEAVLKELTRTAARRRYDDIMSEAEEKLAEAKAEFEDKKAEGERELAEAAEELADGAEKIADGEKALAEAAEELAGGERTLREKRQELAEAAKELAEGEAELADGERKLAEGKEEWERNNRTVESAKDEVSAASAELDAQAAELAAQKQLLEETAQESADRILSSLPSGQQALLAQLARGLVSVARGEMSEADYLALLEMIPAGDPVTDALKSQLAQGAGEFAAAASALTEGERTLAAYRAQLEDAERQLRDADKELGKAWQEILNAEAELEEGRRELEDARVKIAEGESAIADGEKDLEEGRQTLAEKEEELADAKREYEDGLKEYEDARREFEEKIAEAEEEIADAEAEIADIGEPDTYVLGRDTNTGYVCFESDSGIVDGIANVFPVFFFLVAALVCITTMNRMVEEQRTQIGVMKALGYGNGAVMSKYMIYSGTAAVAGCIFGFLFGTWGFPKVIWFCYGIMYNADPIVYVFNPALAVISLTVSLLCSIGTTWLSCRMELARVAAALMRPKAPKAGKRVFLERIPFLWKRLSFLRKVSLRNIFRYKKRFFMMVVGIGGCTALLVTGFGIKDSIADVAEKQFREIQTYDIGVTLKEAADEGFLSGLEGLKDAGVSEYVCVMEKNADLVTGRGVKSVYLVTGTEEGMAPFLNLHTKDGAPVSYPGGGEAVISNKLAEDYDIRPGDMIVLRDEDMREYDLAVSAVYENYIYNYVHVSEDTWRELTGEEPERKTVYLNTAQDADLHALSAELMKSEQVSNVTVNADTMERIGNMMASLNIIVAVVILCAAGLAFIVLYNLTNINITERIREIATVKVLGFYKNETASYVFRENVMLTVLGMAAGLGAGYFLHAYVMNEIRVDLIAFDICVKPVSFVYSALLTLMFAWLVNRTMGGKLEAVSMTESLKSVD